MVEHNMQNQNRTRNTAHDWYVHMSDEPISAADRAEFERWLRANPEHGADYAEVDALWQQLHTLEAVNLDAGVRASLQTARRQVLDQKRSWWPRAALAASAACLLLTALIVFFVGADQGVSTVDDHRLVQSLSTAPGQLNEIRLADGSLAVLGADSRMDLSYSSDARALRLLQGEAYFEVVPDAPRPFTVAVGDLNVQVTGTAFGVRLGAASAEVSVGEGSVDVSHPLMVAGVAMNQQEYRSLAAGSAVTATAEAGLGEVRSINSDAIARWRQGRLAYVAAPLAEVIADANRYSAQPIEIVDPELESIEVSGSFDAAEIDAMLDTLAEIFPLQIDRSDPNIVRMIQQP